MTEPSILDPLWTGDSVWCSNCKHHVNCHNTGEIPLCNYKTAGIWENCKCQEFIGDMVDNKSLYLICQGCKQYAGFLISADAKELGRFLVRNKIGVICQDCHSRRHLG